MSMIEKTYPIAETLMTKGLEFNQKLFDLLTQEADVIKSRSQPETLAQLAVTKKETVSQLEQFSKQLGQILSSENLSLSPTHIERYFGNASAAGLSVSGGIEKWQQIIDLAQKCRALNEQNGAAIDLLLRHNHRLLQILRGKSQMSTTYGPDGSTHTERFSQPLISV